MSVLTAFTVKKHKPELNRNVEKTNRYFGYYYNDLNRTGYSIN